MADVGDIVEATVTKVADFGAFVSLEDGASGLVHISEIDKNYVRNIREVVREGDKVTVKILAVKEDGKIDLSIRQADPTFDAPSRRSEADPEFEARLRKFMRDSQERLADARRQRDNKRQ